MKKNILVCGFTLIELLVVISIIALLAATILASLNSARQKSRDARRIADIKQLRTALEIFYDKQAPAPQYPQALATCNTGAGQFYGLEALTASGVIPQIPVDPSGGCYKYTANAAAPYTTYHLGASLEQISNPAKDLDKDCNSTGTPVGCPLVAAGAYGPAGTPFNGADGAGCAGEAAKLCYDLVP